MSQVVKVRLRKSTRALSFLSRDIPVSQGEACVVRTERGLEYGVCVEPPAPVPEEIRKKPTMCVVRKANYNDEHTHRQLFADEEKAKALCAQRILDRGLPMHLVDVDYTFDRRKVVFYFTAEDRVDFRELVRDLAHELKTRIELRHIQVRDKAKLIGGLAACGRELCCATWMCDFMPISMKMAKRQNLSLNPGKISGQCGRLMCCLGYENDQYEAWRKKKKPDQAAAAVAAEPGPAGAEGEATVAHVSAGERGPGAPVAVPEHEASAAPAAPGPADAQPEAEPGPAAEAPGPGEQRVEKRPAPRDAQPRQPCTLRRRRRRRRPGRSKPAGGPTKQ